MLHPPGPIFFNIDPPTWQVFVTFLGWLSDPFEWLSDLQLGDEKVTKNHLEGVFFSKTTAVMSIRSKAWNLVGELGWPTAGLEVPQKMSINKKCPSPETNSKSSLPLKIQPWKFGDSYWETIIFSGELWVLGSANTQVMKNSWPNFINVGGHR